jgi:hypothetical protein
MRSTTPPPSWSWSRPTAKRWRAPARASGWLQTFSEESEHSYLGDAQYPALFAALLDWIDQGVKPTPESVAARCKAFEASYGPTCRIRPGYRSPPLASRVTPRQP